MFCTCYTIHNSTAAVTHTELMSRQTYKTPEPLFAQQTSIGGMTPFTYMTHSVRQMF